MCLKDKFKQEILLQHTAIFKYLLFYIYKRY